MSLDLDDFPLTIGAMFAGCLAGVALSALVGLQTYLYFRIFPGDATRYKALVAWIWLVDAAHTVAICVTVWEYAIAHFGAEDRLQQIVSSYPVNVLLTVAATVSANLFYTWRIHEMSGKNWKMTAPSVLLCVARTGLGIFTALEMWRVDDWQTYSARFRGELIAAWGVSGLSDIWISVARYYYLRDFKEGYMATQEIADAVVVFTINDGLLTCAAVIAAIICFLAMPNNFVWIGIYFTLSKLFANSVLATLNLRNWYRHQHRPMGIALKAPLSRGGSPDEMGMGMGAAFGVGVVVDREVEFDVRVSRSAKQSFSLV